MAKISTKVNFSKKINVGLVGSGIIAEEYIKVIKSFNHKVIKFVTKSKSKKNFLFKKKHKIKYHFDNFENAIKHEAKVDFWIICSSWESLLENFKIALKHNIIFVIEKSLIISSKNLQNLYKKNNNKFNKKISIGYNRNYYDYIPKLIKEIKNDKLVTVVANFPDSYNRIVKKRGNNIKKNLVKYITSHWICLIYKILNLSNYKIKLNKYKIYSSKKNNLMDGKSLIFEVINKSSKIPLVMNLIPNNPSNLEINFITNKKKYVLSPAETLQIFNNLKVIKDKNNQNLYLTQKKIFNVQRNYKPGLRKLYKDFVNKCFYKKKSLNLMTTINDLIEIYKICEIFEKK